MYIFLLGPFHAREQDATVYGFFPKFGTCGNAGRGYNGK
jgi:hypothetical protein